jgi:hypothetical protein
MSFRRTSKTGSMLSRSASARSSTAGSGNRRDQPGGYEKIEDFLDNRETIVHDVFRTRRAGAASAAQQAHKATAQECEGPPQSQPGGGRREPGWTRTSRASGIRSRPGWRSAKRMLARQDRSPRRRATPVRPAAPSAIFLPPFARKPLIILDSGKGNEIFGNKWKAF